MSRSRNDAINRVTEYLGTLLFVAVVVVGMVKAGIDDELAAGIRTLLGLIT